jgi:O-acetyl-ADP-ribose deacetylase (regulator of RNase III)
LYRAAFHNPLAFHNYVVREWHSHNGKLLRIEQGDITTVSADVIVNAANSHLAGGGGVDGAIHRAAGPSVMAELDRIRAAIGHCPTGSAVATSAGRLKAQYIFHAVGPVFHGGVKGEPAQLASCYKTCLAMAAERELASIAFPAISTGIYGYPLREAAEIALRELRRFLGEPSSVSQASMVLFGEEALREFESVLESQTG